MSYPATVILPTEEARKSFPVFLEKVLLLIKEVGYDELYGYQIDPKGNYYKEKEVQLILFKYFKANEYDVEASLTQLKKSLIWRKEFKPLSAAFNESHDKKFNNIGFITQNSESAANMKVVTWNLYGAKGDGVKNPKEYFEDYDAFVRWRIGLMEQAVALLDFTDPENNYMAQIHDYAGVSFLSSDSSVRKTGKKVVQLFQDHYPEFLSTKYFLNFPFVLAWVYNYVVKSYFISAETVRKFHILHSGKDLAKEFEAKGLPANYGGSGKPLSDQNVVVKAGKEYSGIVLAEIFEQEQNDDVE